MVRTQTLALFIASVCTLLLVLVTGSLHAQTPTPEEKGAEAAPKDAEAKPAEASKDAEAKPADDAKAKPAEAPKDAGEKAAGGETSDASMIALCDEVAAAVKKHQGQCGEMASALRVILDRERSNIKGVLGKGVRKRFPKAYKHCSGMVRDKEQVATILTCSLHPKMQSLISEAQKVAGYKKKKKKKKKKKAAKKK